MKKRKGWISALLVLMMAMCLFAVKEPTQVQASVEEVNATANGVFKLIMKVDDITQGTGSGFLINEDTIITANHCVKLSEYRYNIFSQAGLKKSDVDARLTYEIVISRDLTVPVTIVNHSENMDFAIMKLSQPLQGRTYLTLRDSKEVNRADTVYAVGFPASKETGGTNDASDVAIESGTINKSQLKYQYIATDSEYLDMYQFDGNALLLSGNTFAAGASGGPVVDEHGNVVGIVSAGNGETDFASAIDQVMDVLDTLNIKYASTKNPMPVDPEPDTGDGEKEPASTPNSEANPGSDSQPNQVSDLLDSLRSEILMRLLQPAQLTSRL